jgi:predicted nuclease with TOPRIM domain
MEPYISFGGWLLVVAVALIFAGLYFDTRTKFKQEQKDRAELKDAFTRLQQQYKEVCLDRDRLAANARQIAQDRDKAYDKVEELKKAANELESKLDDIVQAFNIQKGNIAQLHAAAKQVKPRGAISKATYERLQAALANFTKGGAA